MGSHYGLCGMVVAMDRKERQQLCQCGRYLYYDDEKENGKCDQCIDRTITKDQERREWNYYHGT